MKRYLVLIALFAVMISGCSKEDEEEKRCNCTFSEDYNQFFNNGIDEADYPKLSPEQRSYTAKECKESGCSR